MKNAFSGRSIPLFLQESWVWIKIPVVSAIATILFSLWGSSGIVTGQSQTLWIAGLTSMLINALNMGLLPRMFTRFFAEDGWNIFKEMMYDSWVVISCLLLTGLSPTLLGLSFTNNALWYMRLMPGLWALALIITLGYQLISYRKNARRAKRIQSGIRKRNRLVGDKDREFSVPVHVQGIEKNASAYTIVYLRNTGLRTSIAFKNSSGDVEEGSSPADFKKVRESLRKLSNFYRCHREWTVNMDKVTSIHADALGFLLETERKGILIPVSSSLNGDLEGRLMK